LNFNYNDYGSEFNINVNNTFIINKMRTDPINQTNFNKKLFENLQNFPVNSPKMQFLEENKYKKRLKGSYENENLKNRCQTNSTISNEKSKDPKNRKEPINIYISQQKAQKGVKSRHNNQITSR